MRGFRIVIAGHGTLPAALLATTELICGEIPDLAAVGLSASESPDHYAEGLRATIRMPLVSRSSRCASSSVSAGRAARSASMMP